MLLEIAELSTEYAGEDKVTKGVAWTFSFVDCGVDHVYSHFLLSGMERWTDVEDDGGIFKESYAFGKRGDVGLDDFGFWVLILQFGDRR